MGQNPTDKAIDDLLNSLFAENVDTKNIKVISWSGDPEHEIGSVMDMIKEVAQLHKQKARTLLT